MRTLHLQQLIIQLVIAVHLTLLAITKMDKTVYISFSKVYLIGKPYIVSNYI